MMKSAYLDDIYDSSFVGELEKIAEGSKTEKLIGTGEATLGAANLAFVSTLGRDMRLSALGVGSAAFSAYLLGKGLNRIKKSKDIEKISAFSFKSIKSFLKKPEGIAATTVGTGTVGAGYIDTRELPDRDADTILPYWDEVKKIAQPGDVIVGANRPPAIMSYFKDFKMQYDKARKTKDRNGALKAAKELVNPVTMISKIGDPTFSHAAIIGPNGKTFYGGGGEGRDITQRDMPKDSKEMKKFKERQLSPYYVLLRPNKKSANKLAKTFEQNGAQAALNQAKEMAGDPKDYRLSRSIWEQTKRWVLPQLDTKEFIKSKTVRDLEKKMTGGICSTTAALLSNRTIAGRDAKRVLPKDIVDSPDFDIIAHIGPKREAPIGTQMVFAAPKYGVKAGVGILAGATTYGIFKGVKAMLRK